MPFIIRAIGIMSIIKIESQHMKIDNNFPNDRLFDGDIPQPLNYFKDPLLGLRQFRTIEGPLKMMKNVFLFHVKSSFRS